MMQFFDRNIAALQQTNPILYACLFGIEHNSKYSVFQDSNDSLNVNIYDTENQTIFYDGIPRDSIIAQVDRFEASFNRYPILFIYGVANGLFIKLLLQNNNHIKIYVIEPELELLFIALNLLDFSQELLEKRVEFLHAANVDFFNALDIFSHKDIKVFCKTYHIEPNIPYYEHYYSDSLLQVNAVLSRAIEHIITGLGNDSTDALIGLEWHLANVEKMVETPTLLELIHQAKTTDIAIIVSTGPSLAKQLPLLESIKNHVTIFSVDASFPILEQYNIKPDVVFSIERVADTAEFYKRTSTEFQKGVICAMSSLSHPALIESVTTGTLQISMRPFGYTHYFDLPEYGYVGIGMSAANMAYETAYHAKFKTIILIGQDLAYGADGQSHSDGHVFGNLAHKKDNFEVEAYGGNGTILTNQIWNMFRNFFENDIYIANQDGITTINATEGGARIFGAIELPFERAIEQYVDKSIHKMPIVLKQPDSSYIKEKKQFVHDKIVSMEHYVETIQKKVSDLFEKVSLNVDKLNRMDAHNNLEKVDYDEIAILMSEIDEIKSLFDDQQFVDIFIDAAQALIVHHELEIARIQVRAIKNDDNRRLKMIDWIYAHHHWLFALAGIMDAELVAIKRRGAQSQYVHKSKLSEDGISIMGHFYDYKNEQCDFELELIVDGEIVLTKTPMGSKGNFTASVPARFFNDQVHLISVREKHTGIILMGMPESRLLLSMYKNKAQFMESLEYIEVEKIKDIYCAGVIGFFATKENLEDSDFVNYINELSKKFSTSVIKGFYIDDSAIQDTFKYKHIQWQKIKTLKDLLSEIEIYIYNASGEHNQIVNKIQEYSEQVFTVPFNQLFKSTQIQTLDKQLKDSKHFIFQNLDKLEISVDQAEKLSYSLYSIVYNYITRGTDVKLEINDAMTRYDLNCIFDIAAVLKSAKFKENYLNYLKLYQSLLNKNHA